MSPPPARRHREIPDLRKFNEIDITIPYFLAKLWTHVELVKNTKTCADLEQFGGRFVDASKAAGDGGQAKGA